MKLRVWLLVCICALVVAGCGNGGSALPASDAAAVGHTPITKQQLNALMTIAKKNLQTQGRPLPLRSSRQYKSMRAAALAYLVRQAEWTEAARTLGITVSQMEVEDRVAQIKKQYAGGSQARYQAKLRDHGLSGSAIRSQIEQQLLDQAIAQKLTRHITVSQAEAQSYYAQHRLLFSGQPRAHALAMIERQLLTNKRNAVLRRWIQQTTTHYCSHRQLQYQPNLAPQPNPCSSAAASAHNNA